jgi:hypothetical protein
MEITPDFVADYIAGRKPFDVDRATRQQLRDIWNISRGKSMGMASSSPHYTKEALLAAVRTLPGKIVEPKAPAKSRAKKAAVAAPVVDAAALAAQKEAERVARMKELESAARAKFAASEAERVAREEEENARERKRVENLKGAYHPRDFETSKLPEATRKKAYMLWTLVKEAIRQDKEDARKKATALLIAHIKPFGYKTFVLPRFDPVLGDWI